MIFIDTGPFVARFRASDDQHALAVRGWADLKRSNIRLLTSNLVLIEAAKLLADLRGFQWASSRLLEWLSSQELNILYSDREAEMAAAELMARFADQRIGPVDCVSFELMRRHGITKAFAFDRHFRVPGFELWPSDR